MTGTARPGIVAALLVLATFTTVLAPTAGADSLDDAEAPSEVKLSVEAYDTNYDPVASATGCSGSQLASSTWTVFEEESDGSYVANHPPDAFGDVVADDAAKCLQLTFHVTGGPSALSDVDGTSVSLPGQGWDPAIEPPETPSTIELTAKSYHDTAYDPSSPTACPASGGADATQPWVVFDDSASAPEDKVSAPSASFADPLTDADAQCVQLSITIDGGPSILSDISGTSVAFPGQDIELPAVALSAKLSPQSDCSDDGAYSVSNTFVDDDGTENTEDPVIDAEGDGPETIRCVAVDATVGSQSIQHSKDLKGTTEVSVSLGAYDADQAPDDPRSCGGEPVAVASIGVSVDPEDSYGVQAQPNDAAGIASFAQAMAGAECIEASVAGGPDASAVSDPLPSDPGDPTELIGDLPVPDAGAAELTANYYSARSQDADPAGDGDAASMECAGQHLFEVAISQDGLSVSPDRQTAQDRAQDAACAEVSVSPMPGAVGAGPLSIPVLPCASPVAAAPPAVPTYLDMDCNDYSIAHEFTHWARTDHADVRDLVVTDDVLRPELSLNAVSLASNGTIAGVAGPTVQVNYDADAHEKACDPTTESSPGADAKGCLAIQSYGVHWQLMDGNEELASGTLAEASDVEQAEISGQSVLHLAANVTNETVQEKADTLRIELAASDGFGSSRTHEDLAVDLSGPTVESARAEPKAFGDRTDDVETELTVDVVEEAQGDGDDQARVTLELVDDGSAVASWSTDGYVDAGQDAEIQETWKAPDADDGLYDLRVVAEDELGNVRDVAPSSVVVNDEGPSIEDVRGNDGYHDDRIDLSVAFDTEVSVAVAEADLSNLGLGTADLSQDGDAWALDADLDDSVDDGSYEVPIRARQPSGPDLTVAGTVDVRIDRSKPAANVSDGNCDPQASACTFEIELSEPADVHVRVVQDGDVVADLGNQTASGTAKVTWDAAGQADGTYTLEVEMVDDADRSSTVELTVTLDSKAPSIDLTDTGSTVEVKVSDATRTCSEVTVDGQDRGRYCKPSFSVDVDSDWSEVHVRSEDDLGHVAEKGLASDGSRTSGSGQSTGAVRTKLVRPSEGAWLALSTGQVVVDVGSAQSASCSWDQGSSVCRLVDGRLAVKTGGLPAGERTLSVEVTGDSGTETASWAFHAGTDGIVSEVRAEPAGDGAKVVVEAASGLDLIAELDCANGQTSLSPEETGDGIYEAQADAALEDCSGKLLAETGHGTVTLQKFEASTTSSGSSGSPLPGFEALAVAVGLVAAAWIVRRRDGNG